MSKYLEKAKELEDGLANGTRTPPAARVGAEICAAIAQAEAAERQAEELAMIGDSLAHIAASLEKLTRPEDSMLTEIAAELVGIRLQIASKLEE